MTASREGKTSMKCFVAANGRDPRFPDVREYIRSRGIECISNPHTGRMTEDQVIELIRDADATLASGEPYTAKVFEGAPKLKVVARVGVGYDVVDVKAATRHGVIITTTPIPELASGMAEHTFALMLSLMKRVPQMNAGLRQGEWRTSVWGSQLEDLYGLTFGLFGLGRIGAQTAKRAKAFDMKLIYHDVVRREDLEASLGLEYVTFDRLLSESDVLSLHAPLTPQTKGIIGEQAFKKMKPTSVIINTSRGAVIDEQALVRALEQGTIAGAGIDTFSVEPLAPPHPLYKLQDRLPNLLVTPHMGYGPRTGKAMMYFAVDQMVEALSGGVPQYVLNPEVLPNRRA